MARTGRPTTSPGFHRVRLRKRGKSYTARWSDGDQRHEVSLKTGNKRLAESRAREINDALERGERWLPGRDRSAVTFEKVVDEYLAKGSRWSENTRRGHRSIIKQIKEEFGSLPAAKLRSEDIDAYLARRRDEGMPKSSRNRILAVLKSVLAKANEWGYVPRSVAADVKMEREGRKQPMPYTRDEASRILAALDPQHRRVAEVYLQTGMRLGELRKLLWADVDFEARTIAVRAPKNEDDRTVPMSRRVFDILKELKSENLHSDTPSLAVLGPKADILDALGRAAVRAGIEEGRRHRLQHRLRDTAATTMLDAGVPLDRVQAILGHRTISMTRRYAETRSEHLRTAIAQAFDQAG